MHTQRRPPSVQVPRRNIATAPDRNTPSPRNSSASTRNGAASPRNFDEPDCSSQPLASTTTRLANVVRGETFGDILDEANRDAYLLSSAARGFGGAAGASSSMGIDTAALLLKEQEAQRTRLAAAAAGQPPLGMAPKPVGWNAPELKGALHESSPRWWPLPERFATAAERFDQQHATRSGRAERVLARLLADRTSISKVTAWDGAIHDVFSTRFVAPEVQRVRVIKRAEPQKEKKFDPGSVWRNRALWCDAKDFFDTDQVQRYKLDADFQRAVKSGLARFILQHDDDDDPAAETVRKSRRAAAALDAAAMADIEGAAEVQEVKDVLWQYHRVFFMLFDIYAALGGGDSVHDLSLNEWAEFVRDFKLASNKSKYCKPADLDRLFIAVDASSGDGARNKVLGRHEFLSCLVRLSVLKYVMTGQKSDVSDALNELFVVDIEPNLDPCLFAPPDVYRRGLLYQPEVSKVLLRHEESLRNLFHVVAKLPRSLSAKKLGMLIGLLEWREFVRRFALVDLDLNERDVTLCFVSSRMSVIDNTSERGRIKENTLPFEGFLEALCRLSMLKAWPTDVEVQQSPHADAGEFVRCIRGEDPARYKTLCLESCTKWGDESWLPLDRCVENLVLFLLHTIEAQVNRDEGNPAASAGSKFSSDLILTVPEAKRWAGLYKETKSSEGIGTQDMK